MNNNNESTVLSKVSSLFCSIDEIRPALLHPFVIGEYTYATDGYTLIRCKNEQFNLQAYTPHIEQAKKMEKERASTFAIRVISECCTIKDGKGEVNMQKFEALLTEMYGE